MAKIYAELTAHETTRKVSKSSNTRLKLDIYEGNDIVGTLCVYPIAQPQGGHRVTYEVAGSHKAKMIHDSDDVNF